MVDCELLTPENDGNLLASLQKNMDSGEDVLRAVLPLVKLLTVAIMGLILTHPKVHMIPKATLKVLSKLVFVLLLPCMIFYYLAQCITLRNVILWWFIPVNVLFSTATGLILGYLVTLICRPPPQFFRFTIITTAFGNTGNIPLAVVSSICGSTENLFGTDCYDSGVAYVSFSQWIQVILVYTFVYHMMEPPLEHYEIVEEEEEEEEEEINEIEEVESVSNGLSISNGLSMPLVFEAEWPGMDDKETEHCKTPFIGRLFNSISSNSQRNSPDFGSIEEGNPQTPKAIKCLAEPKTVKKIRTVVLHTPFSQIFQPPMFASVLAILLGIIPGFKSIAFGSDAPLEFITDSLDIVAEATVPSVMLIIGGMLTDGPNESNLGVRTIVGIIIARLLVLPLIGMGVVYLAGKWNLLIQGDQIYQFVIFLQYTTPSAILLAAVASLRGYAVSEASAVLFWQHVFAIFTLAFYFIIYFKVLFVYV